jgi:hypothetical protein
MLQPSPMPKLTDPVPGGANIVPVTWCQAPSVVGELVMITPDAPEQLFDGHQCAVRTITVATKSLVRYQKAPGCGPGCVIRQPGKPEPDVLASTSNGGPLRFMLARPECGFEKSCVIVTFGPSLSSFHHDTSESTRRP